MFLNHKRKMKKHFYVILFFFYFEMSKIKNDKSHHNSVVHNVHNTIEIFHMDGANFSSRKMFAENANSI